MSILKLSFSSAKQICKRYLQEGPVGQQRIMQVSLFILTEVLNTQHLWQHEIVSKGRFHEKKVAVQITSTPPPPNLDNLYHFFF